MPTRILVVGGAGFIGSHMTLLLQEKGFETVIFDNLQTGFKEAAFGPFIEGDLKNLPSVKKLFAQNSFDAVLHFAASTAVGESVVKPHDYYRNNVVGTLNLLDCMIESGVNKLIFSSTAAVYGEPERMPLDESHPKKPCNPYGETKWMIEKVLADYARGLDFRSIVFRYFNAAGGDPQGRTGERRDPVSHLIPIVLEVAQGKREYLELFGDDYNTKDGSCVRDFIHVTDLCQAHLLGLEQLLSGGSCACYNLGSGTGYTVLEVLEAARRITGKPIPLKIGKRREGDCEKLVADSRKASKELGWERRYSNLERMISDTWSWMERTQRDATLLEERSDRIESRV